MRSPTRTQPRNRARERGAGLALVLMITAFTAGVALVAHRSTRDAARNDGFHVDRDFRDRVITSGVAHGVELLTTGVPPRNPYLYMIQTSTPERSQRITYTVVEIRSLSPGGGGGGGGGGGRGRAGAGQTTLDYEVKARLGTKADAARYGPPPTGFGQPGNR